LPLLGFRDPIDGDVDDFGLTARPWRTNRQTELSDSPDTNQMPKMANGRPWTTMQAGERREPSGSIPATPITPGSVLLIGVSRCAEPTKGRPLADPGLNGGCVAHHPRRIRIGRRIGFAVNVFSPRRKRGWCRSGLRRHCSRYL
jgi:hypothetical protein